MAAGPLCGERALAAYKMPTKLLYHSPQRNEGEENKMEERAMS